MADPRAIIPFNDPYDTEISEDLRVMIDIPNPTLENLSIHEPIQQIPPFVHGSSNNSPFEFGSGSAWNPTNQPGPSEFHGESSNAAANSANFQAGKLDLESDEVTKILAEWPPTPVPFGCSCCQILREITHTNGFTTTNLELHGRLGVIFHALFEIRWNKDPFNPDNQLELYDFTKSNVMEIREFLINYCIEKRNTGFFLVDNPLSLFYETVCIGFFWSESPFIDDSIPPDFFDEVEIGNDNGDQSTPPQQQQQQQQQPSRTALSLQRQRTGKMTLKDLAQYFHLPIEEAARRLDLCPTVVKKICRREGLPRWPHRKIKSLERQIANYASMLNSQNDSDQRARVQREIERLQKEIGDIREGRGTV